MQGKLVKPHHDNVTFFSCLHPRTIHLMLSRLSFISLTLFLIPSFASAADQTEWIFLGGQAPGQWNVMNTFTAEATSDGVYLKANDDGTFLQQIDLDHPIDVVRVTAAAGKPTDMVILWQAKGQAEGSLGQLRFTLDGTGQPEEHAFDLNAIPYWDRYTDVIGIGLPKDAEVYLQKISVEGFNPIERVEEAVKTFWTFDDFASYSINFLWGPLITFSPVAREQLFQNQPPHAQSANRYFFFVLALAAIMIGAHRYLTRVKGSNWNHLFIFTCVFAGLWLFYDLRMGMEYFHYAKEDFQQYILQEPKDQTFRGYLDFYRVAELAAPTLKESNDYVTLMPPQTPFGSILRYMTYPKMPLRENEDTEKADLFIVFMRPDVQIDDQDRLVIGEQILSRPGDIVATYSDSSFLFRARP